MSQIPTFRELAEATLDQRDQQGIRGIDKERSRYRAHVAGAAFVDRPITEITSKCMPDALETMRDLEVVEASEVSHGWH